MAKALKCDRCGGFYDYLKNLKRYQIHDMDEKNFDKRVDLCPNCYDKFLNFLDEIKNQDLIGSGEFESGHYEFEEGE